MSLGVARMMDEEHMAGSSGGLTHPLKDGSYSFFFLQKIKVKPLMLATTNRVLYEIVVLAGAIVLKTMDRG